MVETASSGIDTQNVTFTSGSETLEAYIARPQGTGTFPAVVLIHEIFGQNDNIRETAQRLAKEGYIALAVDLFTGRNRTLCMIRVMGGLFFNTQDHFGIRDLKAALTYLNGLPGVDTARVGAIGFCMGGSFAIAWACADKRLKVIAPYYANNPRPLDLVKESCPIVGSYPDKDFTTTPGKKLDEVLDQYGIDHDIKIYPNSKHSFFNAKGPNYNPEAAEDSWQRVLGFFKTHLV